MKRDAIRLGGLGPLSRPGIVWAGRELRAGMELAVQQLNETGGVRGRPLELLFEDTRGDPGAGAAAVARLVREGVHAFVGEFHSVVADALAGHIEGVGLPFVCASATLDAITARRLSRVFRVSLPQSRGWRLYAAFLAAQGFKHAIALMEDSVYWNAGARIIEDRLRESSVHFTRVQWEPGTAALQRVRQAQATLAPAFLLLLVAYPEPLRSVLHELRTERLAGMACGDPAGRPVFPDWWDVGEEHGAGVPFLAYQRPGELAPQGRRMAEQFERTHAREPTFVALEGYDSVLAVARAVEGTGATDPASLCEALRSVEVQATRGVLRFATRPTGLVHQQWTWPPACVVVLRHALQRFANAEVVWDAERDGA